MQRRAALLLSMAILAGCRGQKGKSVFIEPSLETLIPADTIFVAGVDVDAIRSTPVFQKYLSQVRLPRMEDFVQQTGLDPRKDLSQILSTSNGKTGFFMARGQFDVAAVELKLQKNGLAQIPYSGYNLFGDQRRAVMFIGSRTAVAGPTPDLKILIDERHQPTHGLPPALRQAVQTIPNNRQVWAAFVGGLRGLDLGVPEDSNLGQIAHLLRGIDHGTIGIDLRNGVDFKGDLDCNTDIDAKHIHDAIRGVIGIGRLSTPDNRPELLRLYDTIKVEQIQKRVDVSAQVAPDLEDKFLDLWLKQGRARP
jgi:hypothetical protein